MYIKNIILVQLCLLSCFNSSYNATVLVLFHTNCTFSIVQLTIVPNTCKYIVQNSSLLSCNEYYIKVLSPQHVVFSLKPTAPTQLLYPVLHSRLPQCITVVIGSTNSSRLLNSWSQGLHVAPSQRCVVISQYCEVFQCISDQLNQNTSQSC